MEPIYPLVLALLAFPATYVLAPERASPAFYEAAVQVIPVLLLTLAVESRLLGLRGVWRDPAEFADVKREIATTERGVQGLEKSFAEGKDLLRALETFEEEVPDELRQRGEEFKGTLAQYVPALEGLKADIAEQKRRIRKMEATGRRTYQIRGATRAVYAISAAAILGAAEVWTLVVLAQSSEKTSSPDLILAAIVFGVVAISAAALRAPATVD